MRENPGSQTACQAAVDRAEGGSHNALVADTTERARWLATSAAVRSLNDAVLMVRGEDARSWLAGQITNDTHRMGPGDAVYALVLDARGKILADAWVVEGDGLRLIVPRETEALLLEHFDKYIVMEDVELAPSDEAVVTVQGPRAAEAVEAAGFSGAPCDRLGAGGRDVIVPSGERDRALEALVRAAEAIGGGEVDEAAWELARLRAVRPRFGADFGPANYPQEAGLKRIAVSFDKGCYLGQEVVCTLENRGQLSRHLVRIESDVDLAAGLELRRDDKVVGQITSALRDPETAEVLALGYVKRASTAAGTSLDTDRGTCIVQGVVDVAPGHGDRRAL